MRSTDMTKGSIFKQLITFAIPILLTALLQSCYNLADSLMLGRLADANALAGVSAAEPICATIINLFLGLSAGIGVVVARAFGASDAKGVHHAVHSGIALGITAGIVVTILGIVLAPIVLTAMGADKEPLVFEEAVAYVTWYFAGGLFLVLYNVGAGILRAIGDSRRPLIFLIVSAIVNVVLNYVFIVFFSLGAAGAALATSVSQGVSVILIFATLMRSEGPYRLFLKDIRFYKDELSNSVKIGVPTGFQSVFISASNIIIQSFIISFGASAMVGSIAGNKIEAFVTVYFDSLSIALMTFVSQNYGARQGTRIKKGLYLTLTVSIIGTFILGVLSVLFSDTLVGMFINPSEADYAGILESGKTKILYLGLSYFLFGAVSSISAVMRAFGKATHSMIIYILCFCIFRIVGLYFLRPFIPFIDPNHIESVYVFYPISYALGTVAFILFYALGPIPKEINALIEEEKTFENEDTQALSV
ncbi:MAG: MATE family efflux transporter [Clostridia bacterium]|nr:MATE family efflux transporter [Clostridia bacterium]